MYLPDDIQNLIYKYIHQLKYKNVMNQLKNTIKHEAISCFFSEIIYLHERKIITYYHNKDNLLLLYKNSIFNFGTINNDTNILIIPYT